MYNDNISIASAEHLMYNDKCSTPLVVPEYVEARQLTSPTTPAHPLTIASTKGRESKNESEGREYAEVHQRRQGNPKNPTGSRKADRSPIPSGLTGTSGYEGIQINEAVADPLPSDCLRTASPKFGQNPEGAADEEGIRSPRNRRSVFERLNPPHSLKSNVDELAKLSLSVYVANFPSHLTVRELWNILLEIGRVCDDPGYLTGIVLSSLSI
ncbi:hypothetical protein Tco_0969513 [Tanacetum coccineum]